MSRFKSGPNPPILVIFGVREPEGTKPSGQRGWPIRRADLARMSRAYWWVAIIGVIFTLTRFSEAFLVLNGLEAGLPVAMVPIVMVLMNLVYAAVSTPAGALSDRIGRRKVLIAGLLVLVAADLVLAFPGLLIGVSLWGLYMGLSQGLLSALVADTAPADLRGTAFGIFNLLIAAALLIASILAGALWQFFGPTATFAVGAGFAAVSAMALMLGGAAGTDPART